MDLGRWSFRHVGNFLGDVLDGEIGAKTKSEMTEVRDAFHISYDTDDLDHDLAMLRPGSTPEKILNSFAPYFEGGLSLKIEKGQTRLMSLFLFGQIFTPPDVKGTPIDLGLAACETTRVYRATLTPILKELRLESFCRLEDASAFAFRPSAQTIFVLFDHRPHPWQVFAIENAYLTARDIFSRLQSVKPAPRSSLLNARGFFK